MKPTLLLAAIVALTAATAASAGEPLQSQRGKDDQPQFVRAEARALGGRADRTVIVASSRPAPHKANASEKAPTPSAEFRKSLGGRNNPR